MRYTFPTRIVYRGDQTRAAAYLGDARALLGALAHDLAEANIRSGKRVRDIGPARLEVSYDGTLGHIAITVSTSGFSERMPKKPALWVPRGFVVYPAVSAAPHGWGLPVQQLTDDEQTPYSPANITPGTDVSRWTVGGPLGQVLLTRVPDGGYPKPDILLAPVCFSRSFGPKVDPADPIVLGEEGGYVAERLRLTGFTDAQSPSTDDAERARIVAFKRGIFERVNAHRVDIGRDPIAMPLFGHYDSAQISSEQCFSTHTFGHYSERFPLTFRTPEDRVTKDGMRDTIVAYPAPNSRNFNTCENAIANALSPPIPLGVDPDGIGIFDIPSGGTELTAQSAFDGWMASPHHREQIEQVAFDRRGMYGATTGVGLRQNYGHQQFIRQEQWVSCGNRVFECPDGLSPISWFGPPSMNLAWETWPAFLSPSDSDNPIILLMENFGFYEDTASWLAYYMTTRETDYRFGWTRAVYSGGRCIAYAPGLVWAAGVHKLEDGKYRLVVLTHNEADQPSDKLVNGMTPILRYYYCDLTAVGGAVLSPESMVRGIYGEEDEGWPWDVVNFAYSWRGGTQVDVSSLSGSEIDLLKYRSQWVFNSTATSAVCLRDYGPLKTATAHPRGYQVYTAGFGIGAFSDGLFPATVQLDFTHTESTLTHLLSFREQADAAATVEQIAVDFGPDGDLLYAYRAGMSFIIASSVFTTPPPSYASSLDPYIVGVGPYDALTSADLQFRYELPLVNGNWQNVQVMDVKRGVFICDRPTNSFCFVQSATPVIAVDIIVGGVRLAHPDFANPTNIWVQQRMCYTTSVGGSNLFWAAMMATSGLVQGYYARRGEDYIIGFNAVPQPNTLRVIDTWPGPGGPCTTPGSGGCVPTFDDYLDNSHYMVAAELVHLGHYATASFASTEQLRQLVAADGTDFRLLYARVA